MSGETARNEHQLHQIVFRWSEQSLSGHRGLGPVASSLDTEQVSLWERRLKDVVWAAPAEGAAVAYHEFGAEAAVIRRVPAFDATGRGSTLAHVIIGCGLDPALALALSRSGWHGWIGVGHEPTDGSLPPLWSGDLRTAATPAVEGPDGLRTGAAELADPLLAAVVTGVFADPRAEFTVIAPGRDPAAVMFAILELVGKVVTGPFTFSTFEATDTGAGRPRVVFLTDQPQFSLRTSERRRIRLPAPGTPPPAPPEGSDELAGLALAWCGVYRRRGDTGLRALLPDRPCGTPKEVLTWLRSASLARGVLADPVDLLQRAGGPDATAQEERLLDEGLPRPDLDEALTGLSAADLRELCTTWHTDSPRYCRWPDLGRRIHDTLLMLVLAAWEEDDAVALLAAVGDRETVADRLMSGPEPGGSARRGRLPGWARRRTSPRPAAPDRAPAPHCLPAVVLVCEAVGLNERQLHGVLASVLRGIAPVDLVRWIEAHARSSPTAVGTVIRTLPVPLASQGRRDLAGHDAFASAGALTAAVHEVAARQPVRQAEFLHRLLVQFAQGGLDETVYLERLLGHTDRARRPALVGALWDLVTDRRARQRLAELVVQEYLASHGTTALAEPASGPRTPPHGFTGAKHLDWFTVGLLGVGISTIVAALTLLIVLVSF